MSPNFLLVGRQEDKGWSRILEQALAPLGKVEIVSEQDAADRLAKHECGAIVIIDATEVKEVPASVSRLRDRCPGSRIIVATASPTWQRARDAFQAGAIGYIRKSWDSQKLLAAIKGVLRETL